MLPAMAEIGRRWEVNEVEVFQEHLATEALQGLLAGMPLMTTGAAPKVGWTALVSCAPGDEHELIPLALAAFLEFRGWSVKNLGKSLPSGQIVRAVTAFSPQALFLTFTTISRLDETLEVIEQCRAASADCRIILGGRGAVAARTVVEGRGAWWHATSTRASVWRRRGRRMRSLTAFRMVVHDRSSAAGALLGVVAIVFLVGQQLSVLFGLLTYMSVLVDHSGADAWIMSANLRNADAGNLVSGRYLDRVVGLGEVEWAEPILIGSGLFRTGNASYESVRVVGTRRPRMAGGPWQFARADERALLDLEAVTVDRLDLAKLGHPALDQVTEIGDGGSGWGPSQTGPGPFRAPWCSRPWTRSRRSPARRRVGIRRSWSVSKADADRAAALSRLRALLPECSVFSSQELSRMTRNYYIVNTGIGGSFGFSTVIAVLIGVVIISLTMYTSVLGRSRDFAVMRAIGGRRRDIAVVVISEALIIAGVGLFVGSSCWPPCSTQPGAPRFPATFRLRSPRFSPEAPCLSACWGR